MSSRRATWTSFRFNFSCLFLSLHHPTSSNFQSNALRHRNAQKVKTWNCFSAFSSETECYFVPFLLNLNHYNRQEGTIWCSWMFIYACETKMKLWRLWFLCNLRFSLIRERQRWFQFPHDDSWWNFMLELPLLMFVHRVLLGASKCNLKQLFCQNFKNLIQSPYDAPLVSADVFSETHFSCRKKI